MNENPCGDVGGPDKDNPRICTYPNGHAGRHSFDALASRGGPATIGLDRLPRITADSSLGIRPSLEDTRWLIAQVRLGRYLLASAEEAIRQLVAAHQAGIDQQEAGR